MRIAVSRNRIHSPVLERTLLKQPRNLNFPRAHPATNRQANPRKGFGPHHDGAFLPGAFTRNIEVTKLSRGFPTPSRTSSF